MCYLLRYLLPLPITYYPPLGMFSPSSALNCPGSTHLGQDLTDHVYTDFRACLAQFCNVETLKSQYCALDCFCLLAPWQVSILVSLLKLLVYFLQGIKKVVYVGPWIMPALMPSF